MVIPAAELKVQARGEEQRERGGGKRRAGSHSFAQRYLSCAAVAAAAFLQPVADSHRSSAGESKRENCRRN